MASRSAAASPARWQRRCAANSTATPSFPEIRASSHPGSRGAGRPHRSRSGRPRPSAASWVWFQVLQPEHADLLTLRGADRMRGGGAQGRAEVAAVDALAEMREVGIGVDMDRAASRLPQAAEAVVLREVALRLGIDHHGGKTVVHAALWIEWE